MDKSHGNKKGIERSSKYALRKAINMNNSMKGYKNMRNDLKFLKERLLRLKISDLSDDNIMDDVMDIKIVIDEFFKVVYNNHRLKRSFIRKD